MVQEAINKAVVGRTVVIVAHRLSTIQNASQIVVIDDHKLVDAGAHADLMERCGKYKDLIKRVYFNISKGSIFLPVLINRNFLITKIY